MQNYGILRRPTKLVELENVLTNRDFGLVFDTKLTFVPHLDAVVSKSAQMLALYQGIVRTLEIQRLCVLCITHMYDLVYSGYLVTLLPMSHWTNWTHTDHALEICSLQACVWWCSPGRSIPCLSISWCNICIDVIFLLVFLFLRSLIVSLDAPDILSYFSFNIPMRYTRTMRLLFADYHRTLYCCNCPHNRILNLVNRYHCLVDYFVKSDYSFRIVCNAALSCMVAVPAYNLLSFEYNTKYAKCLIYPQISLSFFVHLY